MRVLVAGWASFLHGEATAGDVLSMQRVGGELARAGIATDIAWSPAFAPEALSLEEARPENYSHVVFTCGPVHGWQVRELHRRYARCRRLAVGVSVLDQTDPAVTGFHSVFARDGGGVPVPDLAAGLSYRPVPVVGVVLAGGQREYGPRRRHKEVHHRLTDWLGRLDCAPLVLDTRLDRDDWTRCSTVDQFAALAEKADVVVSTRLHGLVFALTRGTPVIAVDPVSGGGKVTAQARAWHWPAVVQPEELLSHDHAQRTLDRWWSWSTSPPGRSLARLRAQGAVSSPLLSALLACLRGDTRTRVSP